MAFDGLAVNALVNEFNEKLINGRIDKIYQPERSEITLTVRCFKDTYKLIICANPSFPRVHFSTETKDNPASPPMFCMLLRKHIAGGKIIRISQPGFERVIKFEIESYDELGDLSVKTLIVEIMGKHSNIILVNKDGKIIDSIFHIDISISSVRQVMPGMIYEAPPSQGKANMLCLSRDEIISKLNTAEKDLASQIMDNFEGISPIISRELVYRATGKTDTMPDEDAVEAVADSCFFFAESVLEKRFKPVILFNKEKHIDFSAIDINQYENLVQKEYFDSLSNAIEEFYIKKAQMTSIKQKTADLMKVVSTNLDRCRRKLSLENDILKKAEKREIYKIKGDLITANIYRIEKGASSFFAENFYGDNEKIEIALKSELTPSQNAQRYYARYNKEKTAEAETIKQKKINEDEIEYLETVSEAILNAETREDISQIREELTEQGYLKKRNVKSGRKKAEIPSPAYFLSSDGFEIFAGKNNRQNDYVTLKLARSNDIWFHTKTIHGSHVIVKTNGKNVPDTTLTEAAVIAAYYSKGRNGANISVDYTEVKNVRKPSGAKPGMVIYDNNKTAVVNPDETIVEKLKQK